MDSDREFCFCTLAVGARYRAHARVLAEDLQIHAPGVPVCILTDRPQEFRPFPQVQALQHRLQSVKGYHDKRFVLAQALSQWPCCLFLDADVRVLGAVPQDLIWPPGLTARAGTGLVKHLGKSPPVPAGPVIEAAAGHLGLPLDRVQWFHEFMFALNRQDGLEKDLFDLWQSLAYFFELQGIYHGEAYAIGLAAAHIGMPIQYCREDPFPFFKDKIERVRIRAGQVDPDRTTIYFDQHRQISAPPRARWQKLISQAIAQGVFWYRWLRLRWQVQRDPHFHTLFRRSTGRLGPRPFQQRP